MSNKQQWNGTHFKLSTSKLAPHLVRQHTASFRWVWKQYYECTFLIILRTSRWGVCQTLLTLRKASQLLPAWRTNRNDLIGHSVSQLPIERTSYVVWRRNRSITTAKPRGLRQRSREAHYLSFAAIFLISDACQWSLSLYMFIIYAVRWEQG